MTPGAMPDSSLGFRFELSLRDQESGEMLNVVQSTDPLRAFIEEPIAHSSRMFPQPRRDGFYSVVSRDVTGTVNRQCTTIIVRPAEDDPAPGSFPPVEIAGTTLLISGVTPLHRDGGKGPMKWCFQVENRIIGSIRYAIGDTVESVFREAIRIIDVNGTGARPMEMTEA